MRRILVASLMLASMITPAVAKASPSDDVTALTPQTRVSTGVTAPAILSPINIASPAGYPSEMMPVGQQLTLSLTVDENGLPHNVQVVKPLNSLWDATVVDAVRQAHFRPATIDNQPTPVDMNLVVTLSR